MRVMRAIRPALVAAVLFSVPVAARADNTQQQADALFNEGRELLEKGRYADACAKLRESQQLAPAIGTLLNLGYCWEQLGRMKSAMEAYGEAEVIAASAADNKRIAVAKERYAAAEKKAPKLVVRIAPQSTPDLAITRNGIAMVKSDFDRPVPVDPEDYVIVANAPGYQPWRGAVIVRGDGATTTLFVPVLASMSAVGAAPVAPGTTTFTTKRVLGLALGGAGLVALGASLGSAMGAKSRFDDSAGHCDDRGCDPTGVAIQDGASTQGNIATFVFAVGLAAIGGGIYLWITGAPKSPDASTAVTPGGIGGRF